MTDEELKPFIGKKVKANLHCFTSPYFNNQGILKTRIDYDEIPFKTEYLLENPHGRTIYFAEDFIDIEVIEEPKAAIPKEFIEFNEAFLNVRYIVSVHKYLCEDDKYRTRIATLNGECYADTPVDEIMAKIAEALL